MRTVRFFILQHKINMEVFRADKQNLNEYRSTIVQSGSGGIDRYIYNQDGEGIASVLGNVFRTVAPLLGKAIKGAARIAGPHLQRAGSDIVTVGSKRALKAISDDISKKISTSSRKRQRKGLPTLKVKHNHNISRK